MHIAIDVPVACAASFEKFFVIASKLAGFHDVEGKYAGAEHDRHSLNWIFFEYHGIQLDSTVWSVLSVRSVSLFG
jgi:hypothetical protein